MTYIIAVDDDPEVLDTLGRVLEREAFDVGLAKSGTEALMLLERRVPDVFPCRQRAAPPTGGQAQSPRARPQAYASPWGGVEFAR